MTFNRPSIYVVTVSGDAFVSAAGYILFTLANINNEQ
jgi:hypothetical protein